MNKNSANDSFFQIDEFYLDLQQDGSRLRNLTEEEIIKNPFPGLRPFKTSEQDIFYGRKEQVNELLIKLRNNNFVAVIGSSGTGKSSLVRAGLIPSLFGGNIAYKGSDWKIAICRPGNDPVKNLSIALSSVKAGNNDKQKVWEENNTIEPILRSSSYGILDVKEMLDDNKKSNQQNLLVIIDQFEELFRFDRKDLKAQNPLYENIELDFVNLLLQCSNLDDSIYVILTMRSEFLGECVKFKGLPEAINKSQYLVPQLKREQLTEVIKGPVKRTGKNISADLVEILINEIESEKLKENLDQLPILQHALMRTYDKAFKDGKDNPEMLYEHYESIGGMKSCLAQHAEEIFANLAAQDSSHDNGEAITRETKKPLSRKQLIAKIIFQTLTDSTSEQKGGRRPTELQKLYDILKAINASEEEVNDVLKDFREANTSFIMPPSNTRLYPGLMLDISHESLMRNWPGLKDWMKEEVDAAELYKKLNYNRVENSRDGETYIRGILLSELQLWKNSGLYNSAWATRYQEAPDSKNSKVEKEALYFRNLDFLKKSQEKVDEEKSRLEQKIKEEQLEKERKIQQEQLNKEREFKVKRNKLIATIAIFSTIISTFFGIYAYTQGNNAKQAIEQKAEADVKAAKAEADATAAKAQADLKAAKAEADLKATKAEADIKEAKAIADLKAAKAEADLKAARVLAEVKAAKVEADAKLKTDSANNALNSILNSLPGILALTKEKFYQSDFMSQERKDMFIDSLFKLKYKYKKGLLLAALQSDLNSTIDINQLAQTNPNLAFLKAIQLNNSSKNNLTDSMLKYVANNYLFYSQDINLLQKNYNYSRTGILSAISKSGTFYAIKTDDSLKIFKIDNNNFEFFKNIPITRERNFNGRNSFSYDDTYLPTAITFIDDNQLIGFINNTVYRITVNEARSEPVPLSDLGRETTINTYKPYYASAISPDGENLATDYKNYSIKVWNINKPELPGQIIRLDSLDGYVESISFSSNSQQIIIKQTGNFRIINSSPSSTALFPAKLSYADFTPDGKYILLQPYLGNRLSLYSLAAKKIDSFDLSQKFKDTLNRLKINFVSLSPDWKKLFIQTIGYYKYSPEPYYFERDDNQPIFSLMKKDSTEVPGAGKLIATPYLANSKIFFDNNNTLFSIRSDYNYTSVRMWKSYNNVTSQEQINLLQNEITSAISDMEKMHAGFLNLDSVTNEQRLLTMANLSLKKDSMYFQRETLNDAKILFGRLAKLDATKYLPQYRKLVRNYFTYYKDTIDYVEDLKSITYIGEKLILSNAEDSILSTDYWNLSWFQIFVKDFKGVLDAANRGLSLYSRNNGINTNLVLGYLLGGECEKANSIYKKFKGGSYLTDGRDFTTSFLKDLDELEYAGIINRKQDGIYRHVEKVRKFLRGSVNSLDCKND